MAELDGRVDAILEKRRGCARATRRRPVHAGLVAWVFASPRCWCWRYSSPVARGAAAEPDRLRPVRLADPAHLRFVASATTSTCCAYRCSGRWATPSISCWWACRSRSHCRWPRPCCSTPRWRGCARRSVRAVRAGGHDRGCGRGDLALPVPTSYGLVNWALGHRHRPVGWLGDPRWAMPAIIAFAAWKNFGKHGHPATACRPSPGPVRGRAHRRRAGGFLHITLPQLGPVLLVVGVITVWLLPAVRRALRDPRRSAAEHGRRAVPRKASALGNLGRASPSPSCCSW